MVDRLRGLKENVIMGRLIPAGTGARPYQNLVLDLERGDREKSAGVEVPVSEEGR